jgi:transposase
MGLIPSDTARAIALIQDGRSKYYVARVLGVSRCTIQRAVKRFPETKGYTRRVGSGRKRSTTARDDHFLILTILRNMNTTAVRARNELQKVWGVAVSERTVRKRLGEHGLSARTLAHCLLLTREHRVPRLTKIETEELKNGVEFFSLMSQYFASDLQMAVREYGIGLAKGLLSAILCQGSVLVVVQSWYGVALVRTLAPN